MSLRTVIGSALGALLTSAVVILPAAGALPSAASAAAPAPADLGTSAATAAGSCWEIKQAKPTSTNGTYWLLTSKMSEPQQFYCDMTTDGGGWVLIGKGRDGWTDEYLGKGAASALLSPDTSPMSSTTVQLSSRLVDQLLDGGRVDALPDGIRLRRATNTTGTTWQESRFKLTSRDRWVWAFGAELPVGSYSFDNRSGSGGIAASFGLDTSYNRVNNTPTSANSYKLGFAFGSKVNGSNSSTSYLWAATNNGAGAIPYTQVYLRPQVTSTAAGFTAIPDGGTAGWAGPAVPRNNALVSPYGVNGLAGATTGESDVEVQAFTQSGNTMFVGGNFRYVQQDAAGTGQVEQPFLAAFDVTTGQWVSSFRPVLNEQVRALATLPNGEVLAGGDFTQANGSPAGAIVALDPVTGATSSTFNLKIENRQANQVLRVRALDVQGDTVAIGGNFTHLTGGTSTTARNMKMLARVSATNGAPVVGWNPNLNGGVYAVDLAADGTRTYAAGHFTAAGSTPAVSAVAIQNVSGAPVATPSWNPTWSAAKNYQQSIDEVGGSVYVGGSEHSLFQFDTSTFQRTSGSIMKTHGDLQAMDDANGVLYAGCHCDGWSYQNAFTWPTLSSGWTQADTLSWFGAWDAATGQRIPDFTPTFNMRLNRGIWAIKVDSLGNVWAGGDILSVKTPTKAAQWSGGFARFAMVDSTPPPTPTNVVVSSTTDTTATLSWKSVSDTGGGVRYEILRDDRPVASTTSNVTTLTVPKGGSNRFFVRAIDAAGNYSASSPVVVAN